MRVFFGGRDGKEDNGDRVRMGTAYIWDGVGWDNMCGMGWGLETISGGWVVVSLVFSPWNIAD